MGYVRQVAGTFAIRIASIPLGLATSAILARWLGPAQLGLYATIGAILLTVSHLGNFGLPTAALRTAAAKPERAAALVANARWTGLACGVLAIAGIWAWSRWFPRSLGEVPVGTLMIAALALPLQYGAAQMQSTLIGVGGARGYNAIEFTNRVLTLAVTIVVLIAAGLGLRALIVATVVVAFVQYALFHVALGPRARRWRPDFALLRSGGKLSVKAYLSLLLYFLILRSDLLLINGLLGETAAGVYNVAVLGADALMLLPALASLFLFPHVARGGDAGADPALTASACRHAALLVGAACVVTAALAHWVVPAVFGPDYTGAVLPLLLLLPGVWFFSLQNLLNSDLGARDYPWLLPILWGAILTFNVAVNVVALPRFGIAAAALSSTAAYGLGLAVLARYWLRRFPEIPTRALFLVDGAELRGLTGRLRTIARIGRAPATR